MLEGFAAAAPRPELADRLAVCAPLIGSWDLVVAYLAAYRSTWHGPLRGWVVLFTARPAPGGLALEGERDGTRLRWIFPEVTDDSFRWRAEDPAAARISGWCSASRRRAATNDSRPVTTRRRRSLRTARR